MGNKYEIPQQYDMDCIECMKHNPGKRSLFNDLMVNAGHLSDWLEAMQAALSEINNFCNRMEREGNTQGAVAANTIIEIIHHNLDEYMPYLDDEEDQEDDE